jgi:hypothetical protein
MSTQPFNGQGLKVKGQCDNSSLASHTKYYIHINLSHRHIKLEMQHENTQKVTLFCTQVVDNQ